MPDDVVSVKVQADASQAAVEFSSFAQSSVEQLNLFEDTAAKSFGGFNAAASGAIDQLNLFPGALQNVTVAEQEAGNAAEVVQQQFSLFGATVANNLQSYSYAAQQAAEATTKLQSPLATIGQWFKNLGNSAAEAAEKIKVGAVESAEAVTGFAEKAELSAAGVSSAFGIVGAAFAGITAVTFFGEMLDHVKENAVELYHFAEATGFEVQELVQLKDAMAAVGAPSDKLEMSLSRMSRAMQAARDDQSKQAVAFHLLGVETDGWATKLPPVNEVLGQLATHLADSTNTTQDLAEMQVVAGKSVIGLTAFLKSQGEGLEENMKKHQEHGAAIAAAIPAAQKLVELEARLSEQWKTSLADVFPGVIQAYKTIETVVRAVVVVVQEIINVVLYFGSLIVDVLGGVAKGMLALVQGDFKGAADAGKGILDNFEIHGRAFTERFKEDAREGWDSLKKIWATPLPAPHASGATNEEPTPKDDATGRQIRQKELEGEQAHALAVLALQKQRYDDEERLQLISAAGNLSRLLTNNNAVLAVKREFNDKLTALAKEDPNGAPQVQELANKRIAAEDQSNSEVLRLRQHVALETKKLNDELEKAFKAMNDSMASEVEKEAKREEAIRLKLLEEGRSAADKIAEDAIRATKLKTDAEEAHAQKVLELERKKIEGQYSLGIISLSQRDALLKESFDHETALQAEFFKKQQTALDENNRQYLAKRQQLEQQFFQTQTRKLRPTRNKN